MLDRDTAGDEKCDAAIDAELDRIVQLRRDHPNAVIHRGRVYEAEDLLLLWNDLRVVGWRIEIRCAPGTDGGRWCCQVSGGTWQGSRIGESAWDCLRRAVEDLVRE